MIPIGIFAQAGFGSLGNYWMSLLSAADNSKQLFLNNIELDASSNALVSGTSNINDVSDAHYLKISSLGVLTSQRTVGVNGSSQTADDSSAATSSFYTIGYTDHGTYPSALLLKYDSNNTVAYQRTLSQASGLIYGTGVAEDTISSSIYIAGIANPGGAVFAKYSSTGALTWQKTYGVSLQGPKVAVDSAGKVLVAGTSGSETLSTQIIKMDSNGTIEWQKEINAGDTNLTVEGITVDSANNVIVASRRGTTTTVISKFDSTGVRVWNRQFNDYSTGLLAVDSADAIYVTGSLSGSDGGLITKITSDGSFGYQRRIAISGNYLALSDIAVNASGEMFVSGYVNLGAGYTGFVAKLPADGSLTGTYLLGSYAVSYVSLTPSFSYVTYGPTTTTTAVTTSTFTSQSVGFTPADSSLTFTKTA